jgi:hypothetical protein
MSRVPELLDRVSRKLRDFPPLIALFAPYPESLNHRIKRLWFSDHFSVILLCVSQAVIGFVSIREREHFL